MKNLIKYNSLWTRKEPSRPGGGEGGSSQGRVSKPVLGHRLGQRGLVTQLVFVGLFVPRNGCGCKGGGRGLSRFGGAALAVRLVSRLEGARGRSHFAHACRMYTVAGGTRLQEVPLRQVSQGVFINAAFAQRIVVDAQPDSTFHVADYHPSCGPGQVDTSCDTVSSRH